MIASLFTRILAAALLVLLSSAGFRAQAEEAEPSPIRWNGFMEGASGLRLQNDPNQSSDFDFGELRLQLEALKEFDGAEFKYRGDFIYDAALGQFDFDLREAHLDILSLDFMDIKAGRQVLTWGTGDLIFLNDLFPKDFQAFFIGRDETYLKAPSTSLKTSFFNLPASVDLVWTPRFNSDRFVTGERLSFFNAPIGRMAGYNDRINENRPNDWVENSEFHLRIFKNIQGYELAFYGYRGYFKNPGGVDSQGRVTFPELAVYGASVRGNFLQGIGSMEVAYYDSLEDRNGTNAGVENSQFRFLAGYSQEIAHELTAGAQYNVEHMMNYSEFLATLPAGSVPRDENRHLFTLRLTQLLWQQNLTLSLFTFYSPSDSDAYLRPKVIYKITDSWLADLGANVFIGNQNHTFFGQMEDNTNAYLRIRYSF